MDGVIVASDQTLEWILPWWLKCYQKHNSMPVAFIDLGLSFEKKKWCEERGVRIRLPVVDFAEEVDPQIAQAWEKDFGCRFWESRNAWFKKPMACLKSPFQRTIWIDIDCEIRGPIHSLFDYASKPIGFAMAKDQLDFSTTYPTYNSGVIVFRQNHPYLKEWANLCLAQNKRFRGDQEAFSQMIAERSEAIDELPPLYNWSRCLEERTDAVIQHWHGHHGKYVIQNSLIEQSSFK